MAYQRVVLQANCSCIFYFCRQACFKRLNNRWVNCQEKKWIISVSKVQSITLHSSIFSKNVCFRGSYEVFAIGRVPRSQTKFDQWALMMYFGAKFKRSEAVRVVCRASKSKCIKVSEKNDWPDICWKKQAIQYKFSPCTIICSGVRRRSSLLSPISSSRVLEI